MHDVTLSKALFGTLCQFHILLFIYSVLKRLSWFYLIWHKYYKYNTQQQKIINRYHTMLFCKV